MIECRWRGPLIGQFPLAASPLGNMVAAIERIATSWEGLDARRHDARRRLPIPMSSHLAYLRLCACDMYVRSTAQPGETKSDYPSEREISRLVQPYRTNIPVADSLSSLAPGLRKKGKHPSKLPRQECGAFEPNAGPVYRSLSNRSLLRAPADSLVIFADLFGPGEIVPLSLPF